MSELKLELTRAEVEKPHEMDVMFLTAKLRHDWLTLEAEVRRLNDELDKFKYHEPVRSPELQRLLQESEKKRLADAKKMITR